MVREFISKLNYWYESHPEFQHKHHDYENADIPNQAFTFYQYLTLKRKVPTLTQFCEHYFKQYCIKLDDTMFKFKDKYWTGEKEHGQGVSARNQFPISACVGRLARSYTTFLREIELFTRLNDAGLNVQYSFEDDQHGIDLKIITSKQVYCVKEFVATKNSLRKLAEKDAAHRTRLGQKDIYLPLHMDDTFAPRNIEVLNKIYLYDQATGKYLMGLSEE